MTAPVIPAGPIIPTARLPGNIMYIWLSQI